MENGNFLIGQASGLSAYAEESRVLWSMYVESESHF